MNNNCLGWLIVNEDNDLDLDSNSYKEFIAPMNINELHLEYSKSFEMDMSMEYTFEYIKGYYNCKVLNYASGVVKDEVYVDIERHEFADNNLDNLNRILNHVKILIDFIANYCQKTLQFDTD